MHAQRQVDALQFQLLDAVKIGCAGQDVQGGIDHCRCPRYSMYVPRVQSLKVPIEGPHQIW